MLESLTPYARTPFRTPVGTLAAEDRWREASGQGDGGCGMRGRVYRDHGWDWGGDCGRYSRMNPSHSQHRAHSTSSGTVHTPQQLWLGVLPRLPECCSCAQRMMRAIFLGPVHTTSHHNNCC